MKSDIKKSEGTCKIRARQDHGPRFGIYSQSLEGGNLLSNEDQVKTTQWAGMRQEVEKWTKTEDSI